jgi:hypothetical protein
VRTKLAVWLVFFSAVLILQAQPAQAGAGGSIEIVSIDHDSLTVVVDFELACTPDYSCEGILYWGDGGESPVKAEDSAWDIAHTYAEPGCYLVNLYVLNNVTTEEEWYSTGWQRVGYYAVCQPPSGTIDVIGSAGAPYSVAFDVTWQYGLPAVLFGQGVAGWTSNLSIGTEVISYTYGVLGTYNVLLTVTGAEGTTRDSICVQVFESYALEVACKEYFFPFVIKY